MCRVCYQVFQLTSNLVVRGFGVLVLFLRCSCRALFTTYVVFSWNLGKSPQSSAMSLFFVSQVRFRLYFSLSLSLSLPFPFFFFFFFFFILVFQLGVLSCYGVSGFRTCNSFACLRLQAVFITETNNEAWQVWIRHLFFMRRSTTFNDTELNNCFRRYRTDS